ncbi:MAG: SIS domain-containing protein [Candidatus Hermodarchaeota archaeon]
MPKEKPIDLSSFYSAYELLIKAAKTTINSINENPSPLVEFCNILSEVKESGNKVHIVGMGRSGKSGMLLGEILKNIGFNVSYLGKSLAKPVRKDDVVIGVTGSGWTNFTCKALEDSISENAKILVLTSDVGSKAARLADSIIQIPRPTGFTQNKTRLINHAPLTPMGTVFEMNSLVVGMGIFSGLNDESFVKGFNEGVNEALKAAEMTLANLKRVQKPLVEFIRILETFSSRPDKQMFIYGSGLDSIVASMSSIRLSHLKINVKSNYDWRFRQKNDALIAISGSGVSTSTLERVESSKSADMKIIGLTSFPESTLAKEADIFLQIEGRPEQISVDLRQIIDLGFFVPSFEYVSAITLDSCVAQLAQDRGITELEMKAEHANIE